MSHRKVNFALSLVALAAVSGTAQAGFVVSDDAAPYGAFVDIPTTNDFRTQLASEGFTQMRLGLKLGIIDSRPSDWISVDFFGAEAGYRNQFWANGSLLVDNQGNQSWGARPVGTFIAEEGPMDFGFCAVTIGACLDIDGNDFAGFGSFQSIGISMNSHTAWLLWDDSGANVDDDYDDLVVRLTYHEQAQSVPEPGTLILLALGLIGMALLGRRKAKASTNDL
jgi:hypothetical protein